MSLIPYILAELETPSDQENDWYGWATNQMSHAMIGVLVAGAFPGAPLGMALFLGCLKEGLDLTGEAMKRTLVARDVLDSFYDASFWGLGALVMAMHSLFSVAALFLFLASGVSPRLVRAIRARKAGSLV